MGCKAGMQIADVESVKGIIGGPDRASWHKLRVFSDDHLRVEKPTRSSHISTLATVAGSPRLPN